MKKLTTKVLVALSTFVIGLGAEASWLLLRGNLLKGPSPQPLPYCEVARNPERYQGKVIRVRATLAYGSAGTYVGGDCGPVPALACLIELHGPKVSDYADDMITARTKFQPTKVDTIIVGRFEGAYSTSPWLPTYRIAATSIEKVSP